jgi:hydrogenase maturation protein HypF
MGRLFDAVAALCGVRTHVTYEGQAAVELEALAATSRDAGRYELEPVAGHGSLVLDPRAALRRLSRDLARGVDPASVATRWHTGVAAATVAAVGEIASRRGLETAVLSGGVFQNRLLLERTGAGLQRAGLRVMVPRRLPPNDGGISFGQAAVAAAQGVVQPTI